MWLARLIYLTVFHIAKLLEGWEARTANEAINYVEYCISLIKGLILQPKVPHFEKFAAAHNAAIFFSRRILQHSMATLQICFLHLCLAQIICTKDANNLLNFSTFFGLVFQHMTYVISLIDKRWTWQPCLSRGCKWYASSVDRGSHHHSDGSSTSVTMYVLVSYNKNAYPTVILSTYVSLDTLGWAWPSPYH